MDNNDNTLGAVSTVLDSNSAEIVGSTESITISTGTTPSQLDEIMNNGFIANTVVVNNMEEKSDDDDDDDLDDEYFKQFEWMDEDTRNILDDPHDVIVDMHSVPQEERLNLFLDCCKLIESQNLAIMNDTEYEDAADLESAPLYMYYVSLENDKMLLHVDFKQDVDVVLANCRKLYEFAIINAPRKVVYTTEVKDLYDVDKDVKLFMNMFGIDNTRGGSYVDVELPEFLMNTILHEKKITDIHFYINRKV